MLDSSSEIVDLKKDSKYLRKLVDIHLSIPKDWIDNYSYTQTEVDEELENLFTRLNGDSSIYIRGIVTDQQLISFLWAEQNQDNQNIVNIISLWSSQKSRGLGLATKLKNDLEDWCRCIGSNQIITTVSGKNLGMISLNHTLGYSDKEIKMVKHLY